MNQSVHPERTFIALLSDFGLRDGYVAAMKAVMLRINPLLRFIDISHEIKPAAIEEAAFVLKSVYRYFPKGTGFVAIVDPGVGSARKQLAVETSSYCFFAPDNGLLQWIFAENPDCKVYSLENKNYYLQPPSNTFHGRDIFAPCAAHWSLGVPLEELGLKVDSYHRPQIPLPKRKENILTGEIIYIDHFGNCITNIEGKTLSDQIDRILFADKSLSGLANSYADIAKGEPLCIIGSHGFLEIAVREGHAAQYFHLKMGDEVKVVFT